LESEQFYPNWLYRKLIEDDLPWDQKASLTLETFFEKFTLHDSYWVGIFHHVAFDSSVTLAFQWDSVWLPEEVKKGTSHVDDWPYLFFQIDGVKEMRTSNFEELDGINRAIGGGEYLMLEGESNLAIDDVYGGQVNISFSGGASILALNPDGSILII